MNKYLIKTYFQNRKRNVELNNISKLGYLMSKKIYSMGNKKLFKPSEFEIDEIVSNTKRAIQEVEKYFQKSTDYNESIKNKLERLSKLEIIKLKDCKLAAEMIYVIGYEHRQLKKSSIWSDPIYYNMTLLEVLIFMG